MLPGAAAALAWLAGWCAAWIAFVADVVSAWPSAQLRSPVALAAVLAIVATVWLVRRLPRYRRRGAAVGVVSVALALAAAACAFRPAPAWSPPSGLRADRPRRRPGRRDPRRGARCARCSSTRARRRRTWPASSAGSALRSLTAIVLTHPQRDHIGGAASVIRAPPGGDRPRSGARSPRSPSTTLRSRRRASAESRSWRSAPATSSGSGRLRLDVLWPDDPGLPGEDPNLNATVIHARFGATDVAAHRGRGERRHATAVARAGRDPEGRPPRLGGPGPAGPAPRASPARGRHLRRRGERLRPSAARDDRRARRRSRAHDGSDRPRRTNRDRVRRAGDHASVRAVMVRIDRLGWRRGRIGAEARVHRQRATTGRRSRSPSSDSAAASIPVRSSGFVAAGGGAIGRRRGRGLQRRVAAR